MKSTKCHKLKLLKFLILAIFFNIIYLQKHLKSTIFNNCKVINKYKIIFQYPLCMYTISSAWGKFSKILHNIHIEAVTRHLDVFCNILVWKMPNWVCCVTVQSQFECGTIKIKYLVFCLKGVIPLKNSP